MNRDSRGKVEKPEYAVMDPAITPAMVQDEKARPRRSLGFCKTVEAQYQIDTGLFRCKQLIWRGIIAIILLNLFIITDYINISDAFVLSLQLKVGILTSLAIASIIVLRWNPSAFYRESSVGLLTVMVAVVIMILTVVTRSPVQEHYPYGLILVVMYATSVQAIRFWYSVVTCLAIVFTYFVFANALDFAVRQELALLPGLLISAVVLCLTSSYSVERDTRATYLRDLLQRIDAKRLEDLSSHDPLTGLGNRRQLDSVFSGLRPATNDNRIVSAILVDIDHFKAFNDTYGHIAGDECLKEVASRLKAQCYNSHCALFRFGGEEFLVLVPDTSSTDAAGIAAEMKTELLRARIPHVASRSTKFVTASFGVASMHLGVSSSLSDLLLAADKALYLAKSGGRNRVVVHHQPVGSSTEPSHSDPLNKVAFS